MNQVGTAEGSCPHLVCEEKGEQKLSFEWTTRSTSLQSGADRLYLGVQLKHIVAHFASPARLLVPAKGQRRVEYVVAVDPHRAGAHLRSQAMCLCDIARPNPRRQSVHCVVGLPEHVVVIGERNCG